MDLDTLKKILALGTSHQYLALAIVIIGWLTTVLGDKSKFTAINVPARWQPALVGVLGLVFGALTNVQDNHVNWSAALLSGLVAGASTGFAYDVIVKGFFGGAENLPAWLKFLALLPHEKGTSTPPPAKPPSGPSIVSGIVMMLGLSTAATGAAFMTATAVEGCNVAADVKGAADAAKVYLCVESKQNEPLAQVITECTFANVPPQDIVDIFNGLANQRKAAFAQGKLEGEHIGCAPSTKDGGK